MSSKRLDFQLRKEYNGHSILLCVFWVVSWQHFSAGLLRDDTNYNGSSMIIFADFKSEPPCPCPVLPEPTLGGTTIPLRLGRVCKVTCRAVALKVYSLTQQHHRVGGSLLKTQLLGPIPPNPRNTGPEPSKPSRPVWGMLTVHRCPW